MILRELNTPLLLTDKSSRKKKKLQKLNDTIEQADLKGIYKVFIKQQHNIHSSQQPMELFPR
jgi:hypothetical protein